MTALISTEALARKLGAAQLKIIDASWPMPAEKRDAFAEYKTTHIPGAVFFDIDAVCDTSSPYPHMLPSPPQFAKAMENLGINNEDEIVVYDSSGIFSAPRLWWMLRIFGHANVKVLDGGLPKWLAENHPVESGERAIEQGIFDVVFNVNLLRKIDQIQIGGEQIIDARSPGRFNGVEPEPRPGLKSGHIPGSKNIFFKNCLDANILKPANELRALFEAQNINLQNPLVATCGSGVTACILTLALYELGVKNVAVYDGLMGGMG